MNPPPDQPMRHRKARDQSLILPLVGLILLTPPVAGVFQFEAKIAGVPFVVIYLFAVWALLIAGAAVLSRRLRDDNEPAVTPEVAGSPKEPFG